MRSKRAGGSATRSSVKAAAIASVLAAFVLAGCEPAPPPAPSSGQQAPAKRHEAPGLTFEAPKRLVALGDVHGDLVVVQVGDQLDRGDDDRAILDLFADLATAAKAKGGTFLALNGNHEIMNAQLDFRYVTEGSNPPFAELTSAAPPGVPNVPDAVRGRAAAFFPGGVYAKKLAERPIVAIVGDSVFVHGGVLPKHLDYGLEKMDKEMRAWLRGEAKAPPQIAISEDGPIWARHYSQAPGKEECATLAKVLDALGAKRMVMGHTPQKPGISSACDDKAWRIDTGMSRHYGGKVEVLEIAGGATKVLRE